MSEYSENFRNYARIILAGVRLINGGVALFVPALLAHQFEDNPRSAVIYALRLFGVRTIIIGLQLLVSDKALRADALRYAIPIHVSDTLAAALAGMQGQLPRNTSLMLTALSGFNTTLAIIAQPQKD